MHDGGERSGALRSLRRISHWGHRPGGLVADARWLFTLCFLIALAICVPHPLLTARPLPAVALVAAVVALTLSWVYRYRTGAAPAVLDVTDGLAIAWFAGSCPEPSIALGFVFSSAWGRALYGSASGVALGLGATLAGLTVALPLWTVLPGHAGSPDVSPVIGAFPVMTLMTIVARNLADSLFARERAQHRDAALAALGTRLLAASDRQTIYDHAWETAATICRSAPGLRVAVVRISPDGTTVLRRTAGLDRLPERLPLVTLPVDAPPTDASPTGAPLPPPLVAALERATGFAHEWRLLPLPGYPVGRVVVGHPKQLAPDVVVAVQSMINQVGLAVRNTAVRERLATRATTDHLTGLANRGAFRDAVTAALAGPPPSAVLFVDLDDFKNVNDELGHAAGDDLLQHVAAQLRRCTRPGDLCARLGGDEFAVLLTGPTDEADADEVAGRLVAALSAPVLVRGRHTRIGASVGVALARESSTCDELIHRADLAMYSAKTAGKNCARRLDAAPGRAAPGRRAPTRPAQARPAQARPAQAGDDPLFGT